MTQGLGLRRTQQTIDTQTQLQDSAAISTSQTGEIATVAQILDLGGGGQNNAPLVYFDVVLDVSAIDATTGDELYEIILEGSTSSSFASGIEEVGRLHLGGATGLNGGQDVVSAAGRYVIACCNERNGNTYRYLRINFVLSGTSPSITTTAYALMRV